MPDLHHLTDRELEQKADLIEATIKRTADWKQLPALNACFQKIINELARRDVERAEKAKA